MLLSENVSLLTERIDRTDNFLKTSINQVVCGDCFYLLKQLPSDSIDLVITSPPYFNQRDYGEGIGNETDIADYIDSLSEIFEECVRVSKPEGSIIFNLGDKYEDSNLLLVPYRFAIAVLERTSVKLVNEITWVKSNPTPRQFKRRLVSSTEPFFHFVLTEGYYYNVEDFQTHLKNGNKIKPRKNTNMGKKYFGLIKDSDLSDSQKNLAMTELKKVIEEVREGKIESFRMKIRGIHAPAFGGQEGGRKIQMEKNGFTIIRLKGEPLKKDIIECSVENLKGTKHPAIYPEKIIVEFIKLLTKENDIILDPFLGSGTTAVVCNKTNRNYIGFELNPDYCEYAKERINSINVQSQKGFKF